MMSDRDAAVVEGEAPESDEDIDLNGEEATEELFDESYNDDDGDVDFDACEEVHEHTRITPHSSRRENRQHLNSPKRNLTNQGSMFSTNLSTSSLRSLISSKSSNLIASLTKLTPKYPGILHKQLHDKNLSLMKELKDIYTIPYLESTVKCTNLLEASNRTLSLSKETVNLMKKTKFNLIAACSRLEDTLQFTSSYQANWATQ